MLRVTKLTDYGIVLMGRLASSPREASLSTRELAEASGLPLATACKILKTLARQGLLTSQRGSAGGYQLARAPETIAVAEIIAALEGPITMCQGHEIEEQVSDAPVALGFNWQLVNSAVRQALENISLSEMMMQIPGERDKT